ncbi:MAG: protoporphyrinogen oxidase [Planctomycetaceae bacterium]
MASGDAHAVVIGAGMAGLAAAEALLQAGVRVTVVEPAGRCGGVLETVRGDGWLVERSADCFFAGRPEAADLAGRLGLADELVGVDPRVRRALVWHEGRALPAPEGFRLLAPGRRNGIIRTPLLSMAGKLRLLLEPLVPARRPAAGAGTDDESLESFAVRRLGREAFERIVQPLAAGVWTADPARLSMAAACPDFLAMEREAGSLWAGERRRRRPAAEEGTAGARYGQFLTLASGIETLPRRLAERLTAGGVRFVTDAATAVARDPHGGWSVALAAAPPLAARGVVVAAPARAAARILGDVDPGLAADLAGIEYAGSAVVVIGYRRDEIAHPLDAAGIVVPRRAGRRILAISFASAKFPGRAPAGHVLVRVFAGGALDPSILALDDAALESLAHGEAAAMLGIRGRPVLSRVERWHGAMPQYHVGHVDRMARVDAALAAHPGLALAGAAYRGVGIPQVIASGQAAARRVIDSRAP